MPSASGPSEHMNDHGRVAFRYSDIFGAAELLSGLETEVLSSAPDLFRKPDAIASPFASIAQSTEPADVDDMNIRNSSGVTVKLQFRGLKS